MQRSKRSFLQWRLSKKYVSRNFVKHSWQSNLALREMSCHNIGSMSNTRSTVRSGVAEYTNTVNELNRGVPESFFGDTKTDCMPSCDAYGTNAQNFDTSKTYLRSGRAFDAPSTVAQVQFPFWRRKAVLSFSVWILLDTSSPRCLASSPAWKQTTLIAKGNHVI